MKNSDEIKNAKAENFYYIGKRLREIRDDLIERDDVADKRDSFFSRKNVCDRLGIDYSTLTNVERGTISITTFKLIMYYYTVGYNPMWIILEDNEFIPKQNMGENLFLKEDLQKDFKALESVVSQALSDFKSKL
jgi:transcriptional regulator with XRE-family HTH domain